MKKYIFGVDLGGTTVKMGLFLSSGELLHTWEIPTRTEKGGKYILGDIADSVIETLREREISKDDVEGIGIGVPGPVGADGTVFKCVNLGWGVFNVADRLQELTGLKVKAGNDANVAALGEMWQGGGKGCHSIVMITLGTGIGGGIILNGEILSGTNGAAGEVGHIPVWDDETEMCGCGKRGCLEQYGSATGIVRVAKRYLKAHDEPSILRQYDDFTAKEVCDAAKENDAIAIEILDLVGKTLGKALACISCVVNTEAFVIGGGVSRAGSVLLDPIEKYFKEYAFHAARDTEFKLATLGNNAGIYGGAKMIAGNE
ncbi:ROK family glucokinase [bacterium]|uniref:ROK family glucokinase n=1 Tax=unclassified Bariatricus TaxID=2677046 RepID=UPI002A7B8FB4|nr:ROK family glucokinase [bacterium]MCI7148665.1 ROK family glucokinase [bacterium]MDY2885208.1 ROK family glucokinase [Bariatricus sp.]MDY4503290.1 ROK family glucokinase [Bariatricus sp.]